MKKGIIIIISTALIICLTTCTTNPTPLPSADTMPVLSGGVILPSGLLPDGEHTHFTPPERYYPETTLGLDPAPGYGRIWPYIGGTSTIMWMNGNLIGICDENGRIICDPYYNSVEIIKHDDTQIYAFIKHRYGTAMRYYDQYNYQEMPVAIYETTLCPLDGSSAETYDSVIYRENHIREIGTTDKFPDYFMGYIWRPVVTYEYITAERDGKWGVLDWDGTALLPFIYPEPVCFHEGLACALSEDSGSVSFINITGETVLGPYEAPPVQPRGAEDYSTDPLLITRNILFYEGFARYYSNEKYGMIDTKGRIIVPAIYEYVTSFTGGIAMTVSDGGDGTLRYGLVNSDGVVIAEGLKDPPLILNGKAVINYNWNTCRGVSVSPDGKREDYEAPSTEWSCISDGTITYYDGRTQTIPDVTRLEPLPDGRFIAYFLDMDSMNGTWWLCDEYGNAISDAQPGTYLWRQQENNDGTGYFWMDAANTSCRALLLYDMDGNPVLRNAYTEVIPIDDRFLVIDGNWGGLIDANENYIIKVSLISYNTD